MESDHMIIIIIIIQYLDLQQVLGSQVNILSAGTTGARLPGRDLQKGLGACFVKQFHLSSPFLSQHSWAIVMVENSSVQNWESAASHCKDRKRSFKGIYIRLCLSPIVLRTHCLFCTAKDLPISSGHVLIAALTKPRFQSVHCVPGSTGVSIT